VALHPSDPRGDDQVVAEESIRSLLSHVVPRPQLDTATVVRASPYRVHQLCATTLNSGRCVLVGDAAHLNNVWPAFSTNNPFPRHRLTPHFF
jgi:2-polyprenyl-6-methoxyphenol hydroxylase-like FAD-dependent oxidoreductase